MTNRFPIAYSTLACPNWSFEQAAQAAVEYGYSALEVRLLDGIIIPADLSPEQRKRVRDILHQHNLKLIGIGASTHFTQSAKADRSAQAAELLRYLELAHDLESPIVRTFGGTAPAGVSADTAAEWVAQSLEPLLPEAERLGVQIGLETHDSFSRGAMVAKVLNQLPHAQLGAIWDILHPLRYGESIETTWSEIGSRLLHVHIKDGKPNPAAEKPEDWALVLLGEGAVPISEIIGILHTNGYQGYLSAEWEKKWHPYLAEPEIALPQHIRFLQDTIKSLG